GKYSVSQPRWSPDGKYLAFLSDRPDNEGKNEKPKAARKNRTSDKDGPVTQVWLLDTTGGEPWVLTHGERGVNTFAWAGNDAIIFAAKEDPTERESRLKEEKDTSNVVEDDKHNPPVRLFRVDVEKEKITRLGINTDGINQLSVSPDGKFAL